MEEYPIASIPDVPLWSENFAFIGLDTKTGIEFFSHIGRWRRDLTQWREVVAVALPDDSLVAHRGIGNARATPTGPGGTNFAIQVIEPGRRFRLSFLGSAQRVPAASMFTRRLGDGPHFRFAFELDYEGVAPVWDISRSGHKTEFMGAGHVEQFGRLTGTLEIGDERYPYDSVINRDHSRGPRNFETNKRHHWLQGYLEDGLMFQLYEAEIPGVEGPAYSEVNVVENGVPHEAKVAIHDKLPFTGNLGLTETPVRFTIEYAGKRLDVTATEFVRTIHIQSTGPNDMYIGRVQRDEIQNSSVLEQGVRYVTADGRRGYGHMERLVPGKLLADPL